MTNDNFNLLIESLEQNYLKEASTSSDMAQWGQLILPLLKKLYTSNFISQVCDTQPLKSPSGKIAALYGIYSGNNDGLTTSVYVNNSFLIIIDSITGLVVDSTTVTIGTSDFMIRYIEAYTVGATTRYKVLLNRTTGTYVPVKTDTFSSTGTKTISYVTLNRATIKKMFKGYSGEIVDGQFVGHAIGNDDNSNVRFISFETRTVNTAVTSRKIKSRFTNEQLQDYLAVYGEKGIDTASEMLAFDIRQELDKELISYIKYISKVTTSNALTLGKSIAAAPSGALQDITSDIVANVFTAAEQIVKDTKRNRTIFVLADPITCGFLQVNPFVARAEFTEKNPYRVGTVGQYPLFQDLYAEPGEYYCVVGYLGVDGGGDSGIIYSPYTSTIHTAIDANTFATNILCLERFAYTRHPQDSGNVNPDLPWDAVNANNSDFFKMFMIDYADVNGFYSIINFADTTVDTIGNFY
jgi:hypothetical protein